MRYTGTVTPAGLGKIREFVARMNKRADKLNLAPLKIDVLDKREETKENKAGFPVTKVVYDIALEGQIPCVEGWKPVAAIEFTPAGNLVHVAPEAELIGDYRNVNNGCDHCGTVRSRKDVVVLQNGTEEKVIGRNCLADFLRTANAEGVIEIMDWLANLPKELAKGDDDDWRDIRGGESVDNLLDYLTATSVIVRKFGFLGRSKADINGGTPTVDYVETLLHPWHDDHNKWIRNNELYCDEKDKELANKVIEWAVNIEDDSDYLQNLRVIARNGFVGRKHRGYAASMITAYLRAQDQLRKAEARVAKQVELTQIGEPGQRLKGLKATVKRVRTLESEWGVTTLIAFNLPGNVELTWFATGDKTRDWEEGVEYTIDCTVKEHLEDEKWGRSTRVNRVKVC